MVKKFLILVVARSAHLTALIIWMALKLHMIGQDELRLLYLVVEYRLQARHQRAENGGNDGQK